MNLRLSAKFFRQFVGKLLVGLLQLQSTCSYDFSLRENNFVWKFNIFIISDNDRKNIELRQAFFGGFVKIALYVCIRTFWQKLLSFWERCKLLSLSDLQRNFFWILSKYIGEVLKTGYYVSIWLLWAKRVSWEFLSCFCSFRTLCKRFLTNCREKFWRVCWNCILRIDAIIFVKNILFVEEVCLLWQFQILSE